MLKRPLRRKTLLLLLLLSIGLIGCSKPKIVIHPISDVDIFEVPVGTVIGTVVTKKPGWFFSDYYVQEIMRVKIDKP
jgi:hypothetical protein